METPRLQIQRYGFAILTVAIALGLTLLLNPWAALTQAPFLLFFGAIILSAWYGGLGTGVTATVLSALSVYFFLDRHDAWAENPSSLRLLLFIGEGLLISGLWDAFRQARRQAAANLHTIEANQNSLREAIGQISKLQESEAYFRQLADNAKEIFWVIDLPQKRIVYMSPAYETIFGRSRQSLEQHPRSWLEMIHPDDRDRITQAVDQIYESSANFDQEYRIVKPDGSVRWIWARAFPAQLDEQERICRIAGIAEDITERKQAEEDLRQSEERLRVALKNSPVTVFTQDQELRYTWIYNNPRYGLADHQLLGLRDVDLLPPSEAEMITRLKHQVITTGVGIREEIQLPMGSQDSWFDLTIEPLRNVQQAIIGVTCAAIDLSSRRQMEEALRTNQTLLNALLASSPIGMAFLDRDLRYVHANEALAQINSLPLSEHVGRTLWEALPHWADYIAPIVQQVMQTQKPLLNQEMSGPSATGVHRHCLVSYYPVCLPNNQVLGVGITCMDITEIKQTEQALRESETRFRQMADGAPVFIWMLGPDGHFTYFNQLWLEFVGQSLETALAGSWSDGVHPDDYQACIHSYEIAFEARDRLEIVYRHRRADGEYRWLLSTGIPLFGTDGTFTGYIGSGIDITDRRRAEMALQDSEERLSLAMEASQMGLWDWNFQTNQLSWSYHHARLFDIDPTVLSGTYELFLERIHPDDQELVKQAILESFTGETDEVEFRVVWPDGSLHWIIGKGQVFYNDQGQPVRMIGIAQENTERKLVQQERDRLLAQEQLARQEAEAANRVKDEFLAVLSHELRSPLNPILGWAKILRSRQLDAATTDRALETIERNARHQTQLIEDLLDVSRILRGKLALTVYPVNLATVIESALETVQLAAEAKSIELQRQIYPSLGADMPSQFYVSGDSSRLQQIVWNLLSNAVKFTPEGGKVTISLKQVGHHAEVQVQDTGHGISSEFLPHVFEYFRQEDGTTTRQHGGLGLGLAIVRHLTELHGGTVRAESPGEGKGAIFSVRLPLLKQKPPGHAKPSQLNGPAFNGSDSPSPFKPMLSGVHVLVVDDEPDMLSLATTLLERQGAIVNVAASAPEALTLLTQTQADVLVGDIGMPTVDGYTLIHQVRQRSPEQGGQIPAIALTAYASESDQQRAIAAGYQLHLSKPVEPEQLIQAIVQLIQGDA